MTRQTASVVYLYLLVGLLPLVIVPGIDEFALLPRLAFLLVLTLGLAVYFALKPDPSQELPRQIAIPLIVFWGILAASALWANTPIRSTFDLAKHVPVFAMFVLLVKAFPKEKLPTVLTIHAATGLLVSVIGVAEYFAALPFTIPSTGRPSATFAFRNLAGAYLATGIPLAILGHAICRLAWQRWLALLSGSTMSLFLIYTRARASWVGLILGICVAGGLWLWTEYRAGRLTVRRMTGLLRAPVTIAAILTFSLGFFPDRLSEGHTQRFDDKKDSFSTAIRSIVKPGGDRGRFKMWSATLDMISDAPILGVGLGNWEYVYPPYDKGAQLRATSTPHRPHNDLLWIWSETGTIGIVVYLVLLGTILLHAVRSLRDATDPHDGWTILAGVASITAFVGVGMFSFPFERVPPEFHFWLSISIIYICTGKSRPARKSSRVAEWLLPAVLVGALLITARHIEFDVHYTRASIAYLQKDFKTASEHASRALESGMFEHQALLIVGEGAYHRKEWDTAKARYRDALRYHPNYANAHNGLGLAALGQGKLREALDHYNRAIEIVPNHRIATYNKGIVFEKMSAIDSAIVAYRASFRQNHAAPYVNLGSIYRNQGKIDSAIAVYGKAAAAVIPAPEAYYNLGAIHLERREFPEAGEAYLRFLNLWPDKDSVRAAAKEGLSQAYSGYGVQLEMRGAADSAAVSYRRALEIDPQEPINWFNLGNVLRRQSRLEEAVSAYERALELDPQHLDSHNNQGMSYRDLGEDRKALEIYRQAKTFAPVNATLNFNLGQVLMVLGEIEEATEALDLFRTHWEGDPTLIHYYMGNVYAQSGMPDRARSEYRLFLETWEGDEKIRKSAEGILRSIMLDGTP